MDLDADSLERLIPDCVHGFGTTGQETVALHLARDEFAAKHARPGRLLDVACGVGYGTRLLAERRPDLTAVGVDISEAAIAYARFRYANERVHFVSSDAKTFSDPYGFESIVSLETIEHLDCPESFIAHLVRQLRPGGAFVASVPTTPSVDANPHHRSTDGRATWLAGNSLLPADPAFQSSPVAHQEGSQSKGGPPKSSFVLSPAPELSVTTDMVHCRTWV